MSAGPLNFRDERGEWHPIDNRLRTSNEAGYAHENVANSYNLQLPSDIGTRPVRVEFDDAWVSYMLVGAQGRGSVAGNVKTYASVLPQTDLRLSAHAEGVKEDLILRNATAPVSFTYTLQASSGISLRLNEEGGVDLVDSAGRTTSTFAAPFMEDSSETASGHRELRYGLRRAGSAYELTLKLDRRWLRNPVRRWPVVVDPTLIIVNASRDCYITSGSSANTSFCRQSTLKVGWDGTNKNRALLYFPVQENNEDILGSTVLEAEMRLHLNSKTTSHTANLTAHRVTNEWFTDATWNDRDGFAPIAWTTPGGDFEAGPAATATSVGGSLGWQSWFPTLLVESWVNGSPNYGILIKQEAENVNNVFSFGSKFDVDFRYPEVSVTYVHYVSSPTGDTGFSTDPAAGTTPTEDPEPSVPLPDSIAGNVPPPGPSPASVNPDTGAGNLIDRALIRNYAVQYVGSLTDPKSSAGYNHDYPVYSNDCQNFVSQALRAGGWLDEYPQDPGQQNGEDPRQWFFETQQSSVTWRSVIAFMRFAQQSGRGRFVRYWSQLELGDVVMVDWDGPGSPYLYHSMVVTRIDGVVGQGDWDVRLTYHTNNRLHNSLRRLIAENGNATWWAFNLYDSY